jgi:hypothetical protein
MARNKQGLTPRQARFLNTLALGHGTTEQVERELRMARHTLRRWMDEPKFVTAWAQTNVLLGLRRGADDAIAPRPTSDGASAAPATGPRVEPTASVPIPGEVGPGGEQPGRPHPNALAPRPPKSDRDLIRARHGEEAARAFDELIRAHQRPATTPDRSTEAGVAPPSVDLNMPTAPQPFAATPAG